MYVARQDLKPLCSRSALPPTRSGSHENVPEGCLRPL